MDKKYIVLVEFPDGDRFWQHWNVMSLAYDSLASYEEIGATGTVIATEDVDFLEKFF